MYTKTSVAGLKSVPDSSSYRGALGQRPLPPLPRSRDEGCDCDVIVDGADATLKLTGCLDLRPLGVLTDIVTAHAYSSVGGCVTVDLSGVSQLRDSGLALLINLSQRATALGLKMDITGLRQDILERLQLIEDKTAANW
jgi:ABC-type transporter Mla MlaB component